MSQELNRRDRIIKKFLVLIIIFNVILGIFVIFLAVNSNPFGEKYVITLYHFNSQFVPSVNDFLGVERNIINESIREILEMYIRHPNWKFDIEISGICLKVMHDNYTDVFDKLKLLVDRDQCELILSPYSEQLSIAFTYIDMIKAIEFSQQLANNYSIKFSNVLFLQENQFHTAFPLLKEYGYEIYCVSGDTLRYYGVNNLAPVMEYSYLGKSVDLMVTTYKSSIIPVGYTNNIQFLFRWYGDGEASNTHSGMGKADPDEFKVEPERMQIHEERGIIIENMGYRFVKVSEWVSIVKSKGEVTVLNKIIPDSTWNTYSSYGVYQWMGYNNKVEGRVKTENDGYIRAENYRIRNFILTAQTIYNYYNNSFNSSFRSYLRRNIAKAWKHLSLAEVSDSTGWEPRPEEWEYSIYHNQFAYNITFDIINKMKTELNLTKIQVFSNNSTIINNTANFKNLSKNEIDISDLPLNIAIEGAQYSIKVFNNSWLNYTFYSILLNITPSELYRLKFNFNKKISNITYSPALAENITETLELNNYPRKIYLPLTNGLIYTNGIGIIRNNSKHYVAMCCDVLNREIYQMEEYQEHNITVEFFILKDNLNQCLNLANIINTYPIKVL